MNIDNILNSRVVYSDSIKDRQSVVLCKMRTMKNHGYFSWRKQSDRQFLSKVFGIVMNAHYISSMYGVTDFNCLDRGCFALYLLNRNYEEVIVTSGDYSNRSSIIKVDEETLSLILDECDRFIESSKQ